MLRSPRLRSSGGAGSDGSSRPGRLRRAGVLVLSGCLAAVTAVGLHMASSDAAVGTVVSAPAPAPPDSLTVTVGDSAAANSAYLFLAAHAGQIVTVNVQARSPLKAVTSGNPRMLSLASGCGGSRPPANCSLALQIAGVNYAIYDVTAATGAKTTYLNGVYTVTGTFMVGQPTTNGNGIVTVPLRALALGAPAGVEDDE